MKSISLKTLMFDLGNVVIYFDNDRMFRQMAAVTGLTPKRVHELAVDEGIQIAFEHGQIDTAEVVRRFQQASPRDFERQALETAFCDIFTPNRELIAALPEFKALGLRLVIVSNTNEAHIAWGKARQTFFDLFDAAIFSHEIGAMKPQPAFYQRAIAASDCLPSEALFIDDLVVNCDGARDAGLHSHHFRGTVSFLESLRQFGIAI